jgi:hypothetical protein
LAGIIKHAGGGLITSGASQRAILPVPEEGAMFKKTSIAAAIALIAVSFGSAAYAQYHPYHPGTGYTIQTPGQLPTYVNPNFGGGYTIQTPGQLPSYVNPNFGGGYTVQTPGQLPTYISPNRFGW